MKKPISKLILTAFALMICNALTAFAADPPTISSPFDSPPDLTKDSGTTTTTTDDPPSLTKDTTTTTTDNPPSLTPDTKSSTSTSSGYYNNNKTNTKTTTTSNPTSAVTKTNTSKTSITKSGPEIAYLLLPSLVLGYAYRKRK